MANSIEQRLQALYAGCGYQPFRVKKFERYELYSENRRFLTTEKVLTFTNTDGRLMAMKPDVTLSIVQDTQPEGLRKVFYRENVYREQRPGEGFREIPQTGLECIGALDAAAVGEVVSLAAKSLLAISDEAVLSVSHIGVISGVLEEAALDEAAQKAVFSAVGAKNVPALKTLCGEKTASVLAALSGLYGPLGETLVKAEALDLPEKSRAALKALRALTEQLAAYGDLPIYLMGKRGGAIGFAVYLDRLEAVGRPRAEFDADVLICYESIADAPLAVLTAESLRAKGETVRVEAEAPQNLRFRRVLRAEKGAVTEC